MEFNKYQTPIDQLVYNRVVNGKTIPTSFKDSPQEVQDEFNEILATVPLVQWLISKDRPNIKDLPRNEDGKAIWRIEYPPIIENVDYFRPTALHYMKTGKLTDLRPNPNPNSSYMKWLNEEVRRIRKGYLREEDGAYITGDMYFYLNYCPIVLTKKIKGTDTGYRTMGFPEFWEGVLWRYTGWQLARTLGQHFGEISARGKSKAHPYCQEVITPEGPKLWGDIQIGDTLFGDDGLPTKVVDIPFDGTADIYKITLKDGRTVLASDEHLWRVKIHGRKDEEILSTKELISIYKRKRKVSDRNPSGIELTCGIPANRAVNFDYSQTKIDPYTFGLLLGDGCFRHPCCYYTCKADDFEDIKQHIPYKVSKWSGKYAYNIHIPFWKKILRDYGLDFKKSEDKFIPDEYKYNSKEVRLNILKGLMDSDGYINNQSQLYTISTTSKRLAEDIRWICYSLGYNTLCNKVKAGYKVNGIYKECLPAYIISIYTCDAIVNLPRKVRTNYWSGNYAKSRAVQTRISDIEYVGKMPAKCVTVDNESNCYLIGDFVVTHNSYTLASKLTKIFVVGEKHDDDASNPLEKDNERGVVMAYQKEFLTKDGTLNKFEDMFDFLATNTQFPRKTLTRSLGTMDWVMGYIDLNTGAKKGTGNEIMGVAIKDDPNKARGKRPHPLFCNVVTPDGIKKWKDIQVGDLLFTPDGKTTKVIAIPFEGEDEIFKITLRDGRVTYAGGDHLFPVYYWKGKSGKQRMVQENLTVREIKEKQEKYKNGYKFSLSKTEAIEYETKQKLLIDPYCMGLYLGDGCFNKCQGDKLDITMLPEDFNELKYAIPYRTVTEIGRTITQKICLLGDTTFSNKYNGFSKSLLTYYGLYKKDAGTKFIPREYLFSSIEERTSLLQGLLDTDGTCSSLGSIEYASKSKQLAEDVAFLVRSLGMNCSIYLKKFIRKDNVYYRVKISATSKELFKLKRKQARVRTENKAYGKSFELRTAIKSIESIGKLPCKCVTVDNKDGLYLIDDFIPTHNSQLIGLEEFGSFPNVAEVIKTAEPSVKEGDLTFGLMVAIGTGGSEGNDFSGALDMIYHPSGSHFLSFENVWDKAAQSRGTSIFCFPSYINRKGCYNEDGISDVTKAIFAICWERYIAKYENPDPMALTRTKAENPITLQDAIMKRDGTKFPVAQISERIQEIDLNPNFYDKILSGKLIQRSNGEVEFEPTGDKPIHKFPTKDNKVAGAVEIKELPKKNREGRVYAGRYIAGLDPIDDDNANTMSLVSIFILDLWTDEIVAEWTGRLNTAEDCYEIIRLLLKFYNAKVMYEAHPYSQKTITPEGEKLWKDIKVGDTLFAPNNKTVKVVDIPVDEYMPIYEITLRDGRTIQASGNHIWSVYTIKHRYTPILMTTEEMLSCGIKTKYNQTNFFIPNGGKVEFEHKDVSIDPYTMGLIIAEGALTKFNTEKTRKRKRNFVQISSCKEDAAFYKTIIPYNLKYIGTKGYSWHLEIEDIDKKLKNLGLLGTNSHSKFLPDIYLYNDYTTRMELLRGLMDGDGYAGKEGSSVFVTASQKLAKDVMSLCRSLGINCSCRHVKNGNFENYRVTIYTSESIFKLPRKVSNLYEYSPKVKGSKATSYLDKTAITDIRFSHYEMGKCVTVDSEDGLYMVGDYVVTHNCNKKGIYSYFKMMNSLYLLAETPQFIKDKEDSKIEKIGNKMYGINATNPINNYGRDRLKDFMLKPKEVTRVIDGQEQVVTIPNVMTWWNRALLEEARGWNPDGNFDRISAMGMLMLYREEVLVLNHGEVDKTEKTQDVKSHDPFFERNYHPKTWNKPVNQSYGMTPSTAEKIDWWGQ